MKKKVLLSSITTILLCISIITGATFALFTDRQDLDVSVTAGNVELTAYYDVNTLETWSVIRDVKSDVRTDGQFDNGGTAEFQTKEDMDGQFTYTSLVINRMTPGDVAKFTIDVENLSNINVQYRVRMISRAMQATDENGDPVYKTDANGDFELDANGNKIPVMATDLTPALVTTAYIDGYNYEMINDGTEVVTEWKHIDAGDDINDIDITINFPVTDYTIAPPRESYDDKTAYLDPITGEYIFNADNFYQNAKAEIIFVVEAVQANGVEYKTVNEIADLYDENGYITDGNFNGEGQTFEFDATTGELLTVSGNATFTNIVLDGSDLDASRGHAAVIYVPEAMEVGETEVPTTIVLADNATIIAPVDNDRNTAGIAVFRNEAGNDKVIIDSTSKIKVDGANTAAIWAWADGGKFDLVLNGSGLIEATNGASAFCFWGTYDRDYNVGNYLNVNIFVENETQLAEYKAMINPADLDSVILSWYVDGVFYSSTTYDR